MKYTDTQRLEVLAARLNKIVVYEGRCRVTLSSVERFGVKPEYIRNLANGILDTIHKKEKSGG